MKRDIEDIMREIDETLAKNLFSEDANMIISNAILYMYKLNDTFFYTEEGFIGWISAFYPPPGWSSRVTPEEYRKNVHKWRAYFDSMRECSGEERKWANTDRD